MAAGTAPRPLPSGLPVVDHHCHLSPQGEGVQAVQRFAAAGGTHLFLATQNYASGPPLTLDAYAAQFDTTELLARTASESTGVVIFPVVAPYPVDLLAACDALGVEAAVQLHEGALELAGRRVTEHRAVAIGEVGRPHFRVDDDRLRAASEHLFDRAIEVARSSGCPAVIHSEDLSEEAYRDLATRAQRIGLRPERLIKHYAQSRYVPRGTENLSRSYLARRDLLRSVLDDPGPWFLETDFLDDPARPGAVLDLATVPKRARWIVDRFPEQVDRLWVPFEESVRKVYGLSLSESRGGGGR